MIVNPEVLKRRLKAMEASPRLIKPFRAVVRAANERVFDGEVDEPSGVTRVYLQHEGGHRLYSISATQPAVRLTTQVEVSGQGIVSREVLGGRLSIHGVQLDESGTPMRILDAMDLPRNPDNVTVPNLLHVRQAIPADMLLLAEEIRTAVPISAEVYYGGIEAMAKGCN